jgi:hypothetical protein
MRQVSKLISLRSGSSRLTSCSCGEDLEVRFELDHVRAEAFELLEDFFGIDGLFDKAIHADFLAGALLLLSVECGLGNDGSPGIDWKSIGPDATGDLRTIDVWQVPIEKDGVEGSGLQLCESFRTRTSHGNACTPELQKCTKDGLVVFLIIDDQEVTGEVEGFEV